MAFEASPSARFYNPMGLVHGGWLALLLDTAMGCAVHSTLEPGQAFTTVEMKTTFVRPVRESMGKLRCEGVLLHAGSRIASSEGKVFDCAGRLVAHGPETCLISTVRSARGAAAPPTHRPNPQHVSEPQPLRLPAVEDRLDNVWRQAGERQEPADVGVRDALLLGQVGDRLRAAALDLPTPPVCKQAVDQQFARWVMLHVQSNPLPICTRPRVLIKGKRT